MTKSFKIARKPGQGLESEVAVKDGKPRSVKNARSATPPEIAVPAAVTSLTTRKTIEVPEDYFFRVKMRALERKMLEKELWAEILHEYFKNHPVA